MNRLVALLLGATLLIVSTPASAYLALLRQGIESGDVPNADDQYGQTIASGDFDGDGFDDVAVASPWESNSLLNAATHGIVHVNWGSGYGVKHTGAAELSPGAPVDNSLFFGHAMAVGDFDGDGFDDLAVGVPNDDQGAIVDAGSVWIYRGFADGIQLSPSLVLTQSSVGQTNETDDNFGFVLATGDFDTNGFDDLAITAIGEANSMGRVTVVYGTGVTGLDPTTAQSYDPLLFDTSIDPANQWFGKALATGDLDGDGFDDLVVGAPKANIAGVGSAGRIHVLYGSQVGLSTTDAWTWDRTNAPWLTDRSIELGWSLAVGRFRDVPLTGPRQIAIGAPGFETDGLNDVGAVVLLTHDDVTRSSGGVQHLIEQPEPEMVVERLPNDRFGEVLAAGDRDGDGYDDLAVGAPASDVAEQFNLPYESNAGAVYLFAGSDSGSFFAIEDTAELITHVTLNDHVSGGDNLGRGLAFGDVDGRGTDALLVGAPYGDRPSYDGGATVSDAGRAYVHAPWRQPRERAHRGSVAFDCDGFLVYAQRAWQRMRPASTTKTMTLQVACDFIGQGQDPDEWVQVRPWVTGVTGSLANHQAFDQLKFVDLMKTMMTVSGNDSAMLLGSFMTGENLEAGTFQGWSNQSPLFAQMMENKASQMGLSGDTSFTNAAGIDSGDHYVTPYDFALLTRQSIEDPCVKQIVEPQAWNVQVRRPVNPGQATPVQPINLLFNNNFVNSVRDLRPSTVGMKGGTTPGALRTGLYSAYVDLAGKHTSASGFGVWGNGIPTPNSIDGCRECLGAELLEIANLYCTGSSLPGSIQSPQPQPTPWAVLTGFGSAEQDTARGLVFDVDSIGGRELGRTIQVDVLRGNYAWPTANFEAVLRRTSELCLESDTSENFGVAPYQQHDGFEILNTGETSVDLRIDATDPAGFSETINLAPGATYAVAPTDGSGAGASFTLTITNLTLRTTACLRVRENGYRSNESLGDGVQSPDVKSWAVSRSLRSSTETWSLEFFGRDAFPGNLLDVSAHDPGTSTSVDPSDGPSAPKPVLSKLLPNVPNPFNPRTEIRFDLPVPSTVSLQIHDARGRLVRTLESGANYPRGRHGLTWDGRDDSGAAAASGVYFVRLVTDDGQDGRRILLMK